MSYRVLDVLVPMADGTKLAAHAWIPDSELPVPVLLVRTPYSRKSFSNFGSVSPNVFEVVDRGYAVVVEECRGTFDSEGGFVPHVTDPGDGADTVRWLVEQDWCDGNVGSFGSSYIGFVQWDTASTGVAGLKAIAPGLATGDVFRAPWHSPGGAMSLNIVVLWSYLMALNIAQRAQSRGEAVDLSELAQLASGLANLDKMTAITPTGNHPLPKKYLPWMIEVPIGHPDRDATWNDLSALDKVESITTPALNIGGWYDLFVGETLRAYTEMRDRAGSLEARRGQRLVIGPWGHGAPEHAGFFPIRSFGLAASVEAANLTKVHLDFFDYWLKGRQDALDGQPPVRIFVMGIDQWRDELDWPLPDTDFTAYYLGGRGPANTISGAGTLSTSEPVDDAVDTYLYDPRRPVPTLGGTITTVGGYDGPFDQRPVQGRDDVLCFQSDLLDEQVEVTGPVSATLFVSSSAVDTDFTAKLVDVHPDGTAIILCDGIQRMRYRNSLSRPELIVPEEIYEITIDMIATSNVFLPGHRIVVEISSSNFPRYDRNSNTGKVISEEHESDMEVAVNRIHRGADYPSRVTLPIIFRNS